MIDAFVTPAAEILSGHVGPDLPTGLYAHDRGRSGRMLLWVVQRSSVAIMLGDDSEYPWHTLPAKVVNPNWALSWLGDVQPVVRPMSGRSASWAGAGSGDLIIGHGKIMLGTVTDTRGFGERGVAEVADARPSASQEQVVFREWSLVARDAFGKMQILFERTVSTVPS